MVGMCFSCQNTPISISSMTMSIKIEENRILCESRVLKKGVVNLGNFFMSFDLKLIFVVYWTIDIHLSEEIGLLKFSSRSSTKKPWIITDRGRGNQVLTARPRFQDTQPQNGTNCIGHGSRVDLIPTPALASKV